MRAANFLLIMMSFMQVFTCFEAEYWGFPCPRNGQLGFIKEVLGQLAFRVEECKARFTQKGFIGVSFKVEMEHVTKKGVDPDL